jgi:hypothetical protein
MKAIYWLNMCKDYNPSNTECAMCLVLLYLRLGQLAPAVQEMHTVLQQGREERFMMEYLNHWECRVPAVAVDVLSKKAQTQGLETDEAMYFFVLVGLMRVPCLLSHVFLPIIFALLWVLFCTPVEDGAQRGLLRSRCHGHPGGPQPHQRRRRPAGLL